MSSRSQRNARTSSFTPHVRLGPRPILWNSHELEGFRLEAQESPSGGMVAALSVFLQSPEMAIGHILMCAPRREVVMTRYHRFVWTGFVLLSLAAPRPSHGDQFTAPGAVVANLDGSFSYDAQFLKEGAPDLLGGYGWSGITNIVGGYSADCFCESFCTVQPGATITIHVEGQLTDPTQQGTAGSSLSFCTPGNNFGAVTTV